MTGLVATMTGNVKGEPRLLADWVVFSTWLTSVALGLVVALIGAGFLLCLRWARRRGPATM